VELADLLHNEQAEVTRLLELHIQRVWVAGPELQTALEASWYAAFLVLVALLWRLGGPTSLPSWLRGLPWLLVCGLAVAVVVLWWLHGNASLF